MSLDEQLNEKLKWIHEHYGTDLQAFFDDAKRELARQSLDEGYQAVALELGKSYEALQQENATLKAQVADLRGLAYERAPKIAADEASKQTEALQRENGRLRAALEKVEWVVHVSYTNCPWCKNNIWKGHKPDCARQLALAPEVGACQEIPAQWREELAKKGFVIDDEQGAR